MEVARVNFEETYLPFMDESIEDLAHNNQAMDVGFRLFLDNCALCHGADGGGNYSIPDLTDNDWLHGGKPENILQSITNGRQGNMPAWGDIIGSEAVTQVAEYVLKISKQDNDTSLARKGGKVFGQYCTACHGANGQGLEAMGAPNLTDDVWLYSGSREGILSSIAFGQHGEMPAQKDMLRKEKIYVLAAYVYSLSHIEE
jgi:cytochrome c oxidase cbb3-type subunit 3